MNWVLFWVLLVLALCNLGGIALYHYTWKHDIPYRDWHCKEFYLWTAYLFIFGIAYLIIRGIVWLKEKI